MTEAKICEAAGLGAGESGNEPSLSVKECRDWSVWRQDDNANTFLVQANLTESEAQDMVRHFEESGHKQFYWVNNDARQTFEFHQKNKSLEKEDY
ncbi:MAG: hypothetical protein GXY42_05215 [Desulfovibrionales bacterium]|nr:hypothetical protein [Desulfovibrionales bacterium]